MTRRTGSCPNCGAAVEFRWSSAVQTVCPYCKSVLVRHDVDLEKVGTTSDVPPSSSPLQLGTEGVHRGDAFVLVGRIVYEHARGGWSEWHGITQKGESLWLSDAQGEYAVSRVVQPDTPLPAADVLRVDQRFRFLGKPYDVTTITRARYRAVEGELPFTTWDRDEALFADLGADDGSFGTLDYSDPESPLLFLGTYVDFDVLKLRNLREFEGW
jgi:hypothetical protein